MTRSALLAAVLASSAVASCVQSSGAPPQGEAVNVMAIDGAAAQKLDFVAVDVKEDGGEYVDGRTVRLRAGLGELVLTVEIGALDAAPQPITPFGAAALSANDGVDSATRYEAVAGTVTVVDADPSVGGTVTIELDDVDLLQVCDGSVRHIDHANLSGKGAAGDFSAMIGVAGFFRSDEVSTSFYDPFPYIGIADGRKFTNSHGTSLFEATTGEACDLESPRENFHVFTVAIDPTEVPAGGGDVDLFAALHSLVFVTEASHSGSKLRQALATAGTVHVDGDIGFDDGTVMTATLTNLTLQYLDAQQNFTTDPPMTIASATMKSIIGRPKL
jgi:hypothetical protein